MKRKSFLFLALFVFSFVCFGCDWFKPQTPPHQHALEKHNGIEATCTESGSKAYYLCTGCNKMFLDSNATKEAQESDLKVEALGHNLTKHDEKKATCTEVGHNAYEECSRCDYTTYKEVSALGHNLTKHEEKKATCTEVGHNAYETCSRCDYTTYKEIAALEHNLTKHEAKEATCTEVGHNAYETCSRCDYTTYKEVSALGHKLEYVEMASSNCSSTGMVGYYECSVCHKTFSDDKGTTEIVVTLTGHTMTKTDKLDPTCTTSGNIEYYTCTVCNKLYSDIDGNTEIELDSTVLTKLGHDIVNHEAKGATCTEIGHNAYETCSRCDYTTYQETQIIDHIYENSYCTMCGKKDPTYTLTSEDWDALWDFTNYNIIDPDRENTYAIFIDGKFETKFEDDHYYLAKEENSYYLYEMLSTIWVRTEIDEEEYQSEIEFKEHLMAPFDLLEYDAEKDVYVIDEAFFKTEYKISNGKIKTIEMWYFDYEKDTYLLGAKYEFIDILPTDKVTTPEYHVLKEFEETISVQMYDHKYSFGNFKINGDVLTLENSGEWPETNDYIYFTESGTFDLKYSTSFGSIDAYLTIENYKGYIVSTDESIENQVVTVTVSGGESLYIRLVRKDDSSITPISVTIDLSDAYVENKVTSDRKVIKQATCTEGGIIEVECLDCNQVMTLNIEPLGHDTTTYGAIDPTCTEIGRNEYEECSRCDYTTYSEIPALGHDYIHYDEVVATCQKIGHEAYDACTRCGEGSTEIAFGDHNFVDGVCSYCGYNRLPDATKLEYQFMWDGSGYMVTGIGEETLTEFRIPDTYNGLPVIEIGYNAFRNNTSITAIDLGNVEVVNEDAFVYCTNLKYVDFGKVRAIYSGAFNYCTSLQNIELREIEYLDLMNTFNNCYSVLSITIGPKYFKGMINLNCNILSKVVEVINHSNEEVYITENEIDQSQKVLIHNESSKLVTVDDYVFITIDGVNYLVSYIGDSKNIVLPNDYNGEKYKVYNYALMYSDIETIDLGNIDEIPFGMMYYSESLRNITIPSSVEKIGVLAFTGCGNLESIVVDSNNKVYDSRNNCNAIIETATNTLISGCNNTVIPDGIEVIGENAFENCASLTTITLPNSVTTIVEYAFAGCTSLTNITMSNSLITIDYGAFFSCTSLSTIDIPEGVTTIGDYAFQNCTSLSTVTLPNTVTSIGEYALSLCVLLTNVILPEGVTIISDGLFEKCTSLASITLPNNITLIGEYAFCACESLDDITIPNSVETIDEHAFGECSSLESITIPESARLIKSDAFYNCINLTDFNYQGTMEEWKQIDLGSNWDENVAFSEVKCSDGNIYIKSLDYGLNDDNTYSVTGMGNMNSGNIIIPSEYNGKSVTTISNNAFSGYGDITSITIPSSITSIGNEAFMWCTSLTTIKYTGTIEMWNNIYKGEDWKYLTNVYDVICSDGICSLRTLNYRLNDDDTYGVESIGSIIDTEIVIPSTYNGKKVTSINNNAFSGCSSLTSITIPSSVTTISSWAFENCSSLTSITIPNSVTTIGSWAFYGCSSLTSITIPNSVTTIGSWAFNKCTSLTSVTIPDSVTTIGKYAFVNCSSLTSITIPNSVTLIGGGAFYECSSLTSVTIPNSVTTIGDFAFYGCYKLIEVINKSSLDIQKGSYGYGYVARYSLLVHSDDVSLIDTVGDYKFIEVEGVYYLVCYTGNSTEIVLPDNYNESPYAIMPYAFYNNKSLTSVTVPNSVTSIGYDAFDGCYKLKEVINKSSLDIQKESYDNGAIAYYALIVHNGDTSLIDTVGDYKFITIDNINYLISYIGTDTEIVLPNDYKGNTYEIAPYAFYHNESLTSVTLSNGVTSIESNAFYNCSSLESITIPDSITTIGQGAFNGCSSLNYNVYDNAKYLGNESNPYLVLMDTISYEITDITINENCRLIYSSAFEYCTSLTSVTIPNSVTTIGKYAFSGCSALTSVTIPNSVKSIGYDAFDGCYKLKEVINNSSLDIQKGSLENGRIARYALIVHKGDTSLIDTVGDYKFITVDDVNYLISYIGTDTEIVLPNDYKGNTYEIASYAFYNNELLTSIIIPDSITTIGDYAFYCCSSLINISMPDSVTSIGSNAFYYCSSLNYNVYDNGEYLGNEKNPYLVLMDTISNEITDITINENCRLICSSAFYNCSSLTSVIIPNSVTTIGNSAFYNCSSLTSVIIPNSVTTIGNSAFSWCSSLTSITIPNSVTTIGEYVFEDCSSLESIIIPNSVTSIGYSAFSWCTSLSSVTFNGTITEWNNIEKGDSILSGTQVTTIHCTDGDITL